MALTSFHPAVRSWFTERVGTPTPPQVQGWPAIRAGEHTLIAAPTGSGKTLAAFLAAIDALLSEGDELPDETRVLYISPLKALGNDVEKNLRGPLSELKEREPGLADVRVVVRSGDTPASKRASMLKRPPHILVTTPESLYILLTSDGGRRILSTVRTTIVDEIHSLAGNKRGTHLALSLERLAALTGGTQRIGLSATQKPIETVAQFLVGVDRECTVIDTGHRRELDLALAIPSAPLEAVCSHETWGELYRQMAALIEEHSTTLVFVNTRKLAERVAARLAELLGEEHVTSHHGSLSKERRLDAEQRLKAGSLRALVATASLELGIDIGDVDLVVQVGATRSIATFLQRVGRAGHGVGRIPKGRLFPLTHDELLEGASLLRAVDAGELDAIEVPGPALDLLAQQVVAACVPESWATDDLYAVVTQAYPYRDLARETFEATCDLHTRGRYALLHRDGVRGRLRATKRARMTAMMGGGAIPDNAQYRVLEEPHGVHVGHLDEDFAVEASQGDVFQLGTTSWQILKIEPGIVRVVDVHGAPPTLPFWRGEAPSRTTELSAAVAQLREDVAVRLAAYAGTDASVTAWLSEACPGLPLGAAEQIVEYLAASITALGTVPTQERLVLERFFDESGGMQLVLHAPFGGRVNRAFGLALRKRFCKRFGFELQAAANEDAILISLGPHHSFVLEEVFDYLHPNTVQEVLTQATLASPLFTTRWRWVVTRSLLVPRMQNGKKVPSPLLRMRAEDALVQAFPQVQACPETLDTLHLDVPLDHPLVGQTIEDCLHEAMDIDGLIAVLERLRSGAIERVAVDTPEPSLLSQGVLNAMPYAFLDDAPLEERRVQAVIQRRTLTPRKEDTLGALSPDAIAQVTEEAWPDPHDAEEVHEALTWMGYVASAEAPEWAEWLSELEAQGRVQRDEHDRWFATEASRDPVEVWRGRLSVLGPVFDAALTSDAALIELEGEGVAMRLRLNGQDGWCDRRLLARIQRYTLERLRREVRPVSAAQFWRFLCRWQHVERGHQLEGPAGTLAVIQQLAGFEIPSEEWEKSVLPARVRDYRRGYLDELTLSGTVVWGRLWGRGTGHVKQTPICLLPRADLDLWLNLAGGAEAGDLSSRAEAILTLLGERGAQFAQDLEKRLRLLPEPFERALGELIARGLVTCDSYAGLRSLIVPPSLRKHGLNTAGRWSQFRCEEPFPVEDSLAVVVARTLLRRTGVVFKRAQARECLPVPWRDVLRALRHMELTGEVRGGRFVSGFSGEQFALPEAVALLRKLRKDADGVVQTPLEVSAADPLNYQGILTPDPRVARTARKRVLVAP